MLSETLAACGLALTFIIFYFLSLWFAKFSCLGAIFALFCFIGAIFFSIQLRLALSLPIERRLREINESLRMDVRTYFRRIELLENEIVNLKQNELPVQDEPLSNSHSGNRFDQILNQ